MVVDFIVEDEGYFDGISEYFNIICDCILICFKVYIYFEKIDYYIIKELEELMNLSLGFNNFFEFFNLNYIFLVLCIFFNLYIKVYKNGKFMGIFFIDLLVFLFLVLRMVNN